MGKYQPLSDFLTKQGRAHVRMAFKDVEKVLGFPLPRSARRHRPWWANEAAGHVHAKSWLEAGYRTEQVDMEGETLVFARAEHGSPMESEMAENKTAFEPRKDAQHPLIGALKGLARIVPGVDLTKPALDPEEWEEILKTKYGPSEN